MRGAQKAIKYFALALAALLVMAIFSGIIGGLSLVGMMVWGDEIHWEGTMDWTSSEFEGAKITKLEVNVKATKVEIRRMVEKDGTSEGFGEPVRVETNNQYLAIWEGDGKLSIVEKSHGMFDWGNTGDLVIYVREGVKFDEVKLEIGAGVLAIEELEAGLVDLDLGAGKAELHGVTAQVLKANVGAGKADIEAAVRTSAKVDVGAGKTDLTLIGDKDDFRFMIDKGIGTVTLDGVHLSDGEVRGSGAVMIDVNSGVGAVEIRVAER